MLVAAAGELPKCQNTGDVCPAALGSSHSCWSPVEHTQAPFPASEPLPRSFFCSQNSLHPPTPRSDQATEHRLTAGCTSIIRGENFGFHDNPCSHGKHLPGQHEALAARQACKEPRARRAQSVLGKAGTTACTVTELPASICSHQRHQSSAPCTAETSHDQGTRARDHL